MSNKSNRRKFIKQIGIGSIVSTATPTALLASSNEQSVTQKQRYQSFKPKKSSRNYNDSYAGEHLNRIAFPIGGTGAGMFCMEGGGAVSHMSVRHHPDIFNEPGLFGAIAVKGLKNGAKILEGPVPDWKKFGLPLAGNGLGGSITGLPHFHHATFKAEFPFATIDLTDEDLPLKVQLIGWSPFIPTDENNSSLPVGAYEYAITNTGANTVDTVFSFNAKNFLKTDGGKNSIRPFKNGFILSETGTEEKPHLKGDFAIFSDDDKTVVNHCWFRGGWWDPLTMSWNNIKSGELVSHEPVESGAPGASLFIPLNLSPGETKRIKIYFAWYVPSSDIKHGKVDENKEVCDAATGCCFSTDQLGLGSIDTESIIYRPWYSSKFKSVEEVCAYWKTEYETLKKNSTLFKDAFYASTLPPEVTEAVASNLSILKSPTVMRQYDGRFWCYEGSGDTWGCCHGSCTHVWNYAQAIPHLFPALERSLRQTEFCEDQNKEGHQTFRAALPIKPVDHSFHSAADGQLGGIMKVYREWRISGDNEWLKKMYPMVKVSIDYCIRTWDPFEKGVIEEPHHNTYDIEFWGPDGMHATFYAGGVSSIVAMGKFLKKDVKRYEKLLTKIKKYTETELYDGEYFIQKIQYTGLKAKDPVTESAISINAGEYSDEAKALLEKEGPKYQYGTGCLSDGVLGSWMASMCGLNDPLDAEKIKSHLLAVHKHNLKEDLSDHANPQRPSFALGEEGGLLLCSWPKGGKLSLPFVYSDEVWTGIEHQVASHLMLMGKVKEGLDILRSSRDRYNGRVRNPFNEYECGNWYARALASYGYIQSLTGVRFDAVDKTLFVDSKVGNFTSFLSTNTGFGTVTFRDGKISVKDVYGKIPVEKVNIAGKTSSFKS